jgi:replicative DNA helicase
MNEVARLKVDLDGAVVAAEQQLLGAILADNSLFDRVADILTVEHFFDPVHARIFAICAARITKGHLSSAPALMPIMQDDEGLRELGGPKYLVRLVGAAIPAFMVRDYAVVVVEHCVRRRLSQVSHDTVERLQSGEDTSAVKAALQTALFALPEAAGQESSVSFTKAMTDAIEQANEHYQGNATYLKTGIAALDNIIRGLGPGNTMLIGGTTSMGKTSLALEIASNLAIDRGGHVGFWSLEMSHEELATRLASQRSRVPYAELRDPAQMSESDFRKWVEAGFAINNAPIRIVPKHVRDLAAGHAAMRRIKREFGGRLDLVIVDYAQLVRGQGKEMRERMTEVSIGLKAMGGLLGCPVIALVQLDRRIGERDNKRPVLADIKESGQFENDADQVVFCHREEYWLERQGPKAGKDGVVSATNQADFEADLKASRNLLELIVAKNRHGRIATARVGFHAPTNRFWSLEHDTQSQAEGF